MTTIAVDLEKLWQQALVEGRRATQAAHLPLRKRNWLGPAGALAGAGLGNSLEFEDHRPYAPGDDLRHLDWQAYGRSDQLIMKLHRHEASPLVDLVIDASRSHWIDAEKARRTLELAAFVIEDAIGMQALLKVWIAGAEVRPWEIPAAAAGRPPEGLSVELPGGPAIERVPWRRDALRVLISDLLFPVFETSDLLRFGGPRGLGVVFAPWTRDESEPDWDGPMDLVDAESRVRREQRVDAALLERYRRAYERHFSAWSDTLRRHAIGLARVNSDARLVAALSESAGRTGMIEWAA